MPYAMHSYYLRNMYMRNLLKEPGGITLSDVPINLAEIKAPTYFISTLEDHIAPWKSTYLGTQLFSGPVRSSIGGSGHIAKSSIHQQPTNTDIGPAALSRRRLTSGWRARASTRILVD